MHRNDIDWGGWILTVVMLGVFWPIGLVLLFRQLNGAKGSRRRAYAKRHPVDIERERQAREYYAQAAQRGAQGFAQSAPEQSDAYRQSSAAESRGPIQGKYEQTQWNTRQQTWEARQAADTSSQNRGWEAVKQTTDQSARQKRKKTAAENKALALARTLSITGGVVAGIFGIAILSAVGDYWGGGSLRSLLGDLFPLLGFFGAGVMCLFAGHRQRNKAKRYKKYLSYIGRNQEISISALAAAMGEQEKTVYSDLQDMLDNGALPMGYIDVAEGMLILSDQGLQTSAPPPETTKKAAKQEVKRDLEDENAILQEIREVNDAIPDRAMSAKIDRVGEITGKILIYQRSHPSKSGQLRSFLNYYLPTTLKILRAYAQLDAQGIEGENISAAKKRIESMMDQVVNGFEKQLDKLFADDALDITSDVQVLENMLRQDGLSGDGMAFGGTSPQTGETTFSSQQAYLDLQKVADELDRVTGTEGRKDRDSNQGITLKL